MQQNHGYVAFFVYLYSSYMTRDIKLAIMGFPTKIQLIKREKSEQWYVNFPSAVAQAMEFEKGELVEWIISKNGTLSLKRTSKTSSESKKKP